MKIKFKKDCELEIVTNYDEEADEIETTDEVFKAGEVHDVDLMDERVWVFLRLRLRIFISRYH